VISLNEKILVVDDDVNICELIKLYLEKEGFAVVTAHDGEAAVAKFKSEAPSLVVLDVMLPKTDGIGVCRQIRQISNIPVLMLSAKGETFDRVLGLEIGADDYIVKPFENKELVARIKAILRRYKPSHDSGVQEVVYPNLIVNLTNYELRVNGNLIETPPKELEVLYFLCSNPNMVFTRDQLLDKVWGFDFYGDTRTVDVHVKRLREKLGADDTHWQLKTIWGVGYKFEVK